MKVLLIDSGSNNSEYLSQQLNQIVDLIVFSPNKLSFQKNNPKIKCINWLQNQEINPFYLKNIDFIINFMGDSTVPSDIPKHIKGTSFLLKSFINSHFPSNPTLIQITNLKPDSFYQDRLSQHRNKFKKLFILEVASFFNKESLGEFKKQNQEMIYVLNEISFKEEILNIINEKEDAQKERLNFRINKEDYFKKFPKENKENYFKFYINKILRKLSTQYP